MAPNVGLECSVVEGEATPVDEVARQMGRQAVEAVAVVNGSNRNVTMCSDVTSSRSRPGEHSSIRDGPDPFAVQTRMDGTPDSSSDESVRRSPTELGRRGIVEYRRPQVNEFGGHGIQEQRCSLENLRAEFNEGLRTQQAMFISAREEFEMRQADTLANAWAVLESSLANMRSPAEVNNTSGRVVEVVSPTRSIESEGPRRNPSPRGEENGRRLTGNALVDAASVPLVYPPTELGRQGIPYEMEGSGMIPGGMPSGVPPSVYLTPVDAQNQQYMSRKMTMIPEGMPSGVPASVCRIPMDALNHQPVNRDIMNSVCGNAMQCSSELFPPAGSVYYGTAPDTVAPVNTRMFREPAMSFSHSEQTVSEQVSEADSGIEKSDSGRSRGNSREELGDRQPSLSRSAVRSARHASIGNDGQVFLFGSSDSDETENRPVNTEQQSESSKRHVEPSAKRKIAEQLTQTRKLNRKHVASPEKVSKGRRGRSASKERHRRSRPSSETRSPNCHGEERNGRNRLVNLNEPSPSVKNEGRSQGSKKSGKQVHRGDKVVLVDSADDSSSETDEDELNSPSIVVKSRHVMRPPNSMAKVHLRLFGRSLRIA